MEAKELCASVVRSEVPTMMEILIECERRGLTPLQTDWFIDGAVRARHATAVHGPRVAAWADKGKDWMLSEIKSRASH